MLQKKDLKEKADNSNEQFRKYTDVQKVPK